MAGTIKLDGTTFLSKSGSDFTVDVGTDGSYANGSINSNVTFPAGNVIKKTYYSIGRGTYTHSNFPSDDTVPQRSEGDEIFSQAYSPSTSNCTLFITTYIRLGEASNIVNGIQCGLFISDNDDCLIIGEEYADSGGNIHSGNVILMYSMSSWGTSSKTFSLRAGGGNRFNYFNTDGQYAQAKYGASATSAFIVEEIAT